MQIKLTFKCSFLPLVAKNKNKKKNIYSIHRDKYIVPFIRQLGLKEKSRNYCKNKTNLPNYIDTFYFSGGQLALTV